VPASNITSEGIIEIYNGEKTVWPHGRRIRTPLRQSNEIDFQIVKKISPEISKAIDVAMSRPGMLTVLTDQENADIIEKTPGAFGISTLAQVIAEKRQLNVLSYNGVRPNMKNLASGKYPLSRFYFVVIQAIMSEPVRQFLAFMRSAHGKSILEENGQVLMVR
jgi:phosphate transport system substrate-binding protein